MKNLPYLTILLWICTIGIYIFARDIALLPLVKFPLIIILSIFITVSFWILQKAGKRLFALLFIVFYFINIGSITYGITSNYNILLSLEDFQENCINPQMAALLIKGDDETERTIASRIIYEKHGVSLPFMTGKKDRFALHSPTKESRDRYIANHDKNYRISQYKRQVSQQTVPLFFLLILQLTIFNGLLIFLILYDRSSSNTFTNHQVNR